MKLEQKYTYLQLSELNRVKLHGYIWGLITGATWVFYFYLLDIIF